MSRVNITGQLNLERALCGGSQPTLIDRRPSSVSTARIRDWNAFCDAVDEALAPLSGIKAAAKCSQALGDLISAAGLLYILYLLLFPDQLPLFVGHGPLKYAALFVCPCALVYLYAHCKLRMQLVSVMERVAEVCESCSASSGGVRYRLESELWGCCNRPHVRRYYIVVEAGDVETAAYDVEEQIQNAGATVAEYFSTDPKRETSVPMAYAEVVE